MGIAGFVTFWMTWDKDVLRPSVSNMTKKTDMQQAKWLPYYLSHISRDGVKTSVWETTKTRHGNV